MNSPDDDCVYDDERMGWFDETPRRGGSDPVPRSADECEFGDEEYQWRLWSAGL